MRVDRVWGLGRSRLTSMALATSAIVAGAGCGDDGGLRWEAERATEVRELEFLEEVEVIQMTRAEYREQAEKNVGEVDEEALRHMADTYGRLGFFPRELDLRPILASSSSDWVGASYSPLTKRITLVKDRPEDAPPSTQVHEYVHALQDQHFDLLAYEGKTSDEYLAHRAVAEGDAVLAEFRFLAQDEHDAEVDGWDWPQTMSNYWAWAEDLLASADYPVFFLDYPSFVYPNGLRYAATNLLGPSFDAPPPHDWSLEDELFTERPPATTQQVLQGDAATALDPVERIGLGAVPPDLDGRLETDSWDSLGEWYTRLLLYASAGADHAPGLASRWDGDRVLFARDTMRGGAIASIWASAWEDESSAVQIVEALNQLYGRIPDPDGAEAGVASDGEALWIEQRGDSVVVIKNLDPELAPQMAEAAFHPPAAERAGRARPLAWWIRELRSGRAPHLR
jgi:hypothetical protein